MKDSEAVTSELFATGKPLTDSDSDCSVDCGGYRLPSRAEHRMMNQRAMQKALSSLASETRAKANTQAAQTAAAKAEQERLKAQRREDRAMAARTKRVLLLGFKG